MYFNKLIVINYRSCNILDLDLLPNEANILIGINDCGKSTILKSIENLLSLKPSFNFQKDDKKKNDLSNTRADIDTINRVFSENNIPPIYYNDKVCYIIGKFILEKDDLSEENIQNLSPHMSWVLENLENENNHIWLGKTFDETTNSIKDIILTPDVYEGGNYLKLYSAKDTELRKKISELKIPKEEIENDNESGRFKKTELARAIYKRKEIQQYWIEYENRPKDAHFFPECRYLDWNISLEQLTQFTTDVINTKINSQLEFATRFANRQAGKAQQIINDELKSFTTEFAKDLPNIVGFKANLSLQIKSQLTDILINKANTDGDIHLEQQGEGIKRQIWFALIKWKALSSIKEGMNSKKFIWCFDEPETHLYPKAQREFFDLIKSVSSGNVQSIISTHSTVFIDRANFNSICKIELKNGYTKFSKCATVSDIYNVLQLKNSDFLFYDKFLVVEGSTEEYLIPHFFAIATQNTRSLISCGIQIINLGGKDKRSQNKRMLDNILKGFNKSKESVVYIFDNDISFDGLTRNELEEMIHFKVGKQDIEDSIPIEIWHKIIKDNLPEIKVTIDEIKDIHSKIPLDRKINSNEKFYPKLRTFLKKRLGRTKDTF